MASMEPRLSGLMSEPSSVCPSPSSLTHLPMAGTCSWAPLCVMFTVPLPTPAIGRMRCFLPPPPHVPLHTVLAQHLFQEHLPVQGQKGPVWLL